MEEPSDVRLKQPRAGNGAGRAAMMRRSAAAVIAALASAALFFVVLFTCLEWVAFNERGYADQQQRLGLGQTAGVSDEDRGRIMHELLLYCRGGRTDLNMQATIHGQPREVFSQREKDHMVDVQRLFVRGFKARTILIVAFLFLLLLLLYVARKSFLRELARGWLIAVAALGALLVAVGIYFAVDFESAWTQFHLLFFTNDLWLLYEDDMLIQLLLPLFDGIVQSILLLSAAAMVIITTGAAYALRRTGRKRIAGEDEK